jgi:hypothetical protein
MEAWTFRIPEIESGVSTAASVSSSLGSDPGNYLARHASVSCGNVREQPSRSVMVIHLHVGVSGSVVQDGGSHAVGMAGP